METSYVQSLMAHQPCGVPRTAICHPCTRMWSLYHFPKRNADGVRCDNGHLQYPPKPEGGPSSPVNTSCPGTAITQHLPDPPYDNYFYSDCHVSAQAVVTSPLPDSNLTIIGPRFIIAWPAGNSGICAFFAPQNGINGSLGIELVNSTIGSPLASTYQAPAGSAVATVGVTGILSFNSSATLSIPILGSVRTIRDFTEGPSLLRPIIQDAIKAHTFNSTGASLTRLWLDNVTTTTFSLVPHGNGKVKISNTTLSCKSNCFYAFCCDHCLCTRLPVVSGMLSSHCYLIEVLGYLVPERRNIGVLNFWY